MSEYNPSFSICIPNFNYGKYIGDTIKSVLSQSYQNFEIIIVDNASTDDSVAIVKSFKDPRIKLYENNYNIGFAPNLQKVTALAKNEFINLLSSDDQMKPNALETYAGIIKSRNKISPLILLSDFEIFDDENNVTLISTKHNNSFARNTRPPQSKSINQISYSSHQGYDVLKDGVSRLDTVGGFCTTVYSRDLWEKVEGYNSVRTINPDMHFILKMLTQNPELIYVNKVLFRYRDQLSDNRSSTISNIRHQMDQYLNVLEFSAPNIFEITGINEDQLSKKFINSFCIDKSLSSLSSGNYSLAWKISAFAMSTYPIKYLLNPKGYLLLFLLALGPISILVAPTLKLLYKLFKKN